MADETIPDRGAVDTTLVTKLAADCGFELAGVAPAVPLADSTRFHEWVGRGFAGEMRYLTDHRAEKRNDPRSLLASARSVICVGLLYNGPQPYSTGMQPSDLAWISRYAWGDDYHGVLREKLQLLTAKLLEKQEFEYKICVDTAPLLERSYAREAGLGWIGKNTCLIHEGAGSWFFLGEILTSLDLFPHTPPPDRCGTCTMCIDTCPTSAIIDHGGCFSIDSRLCISYLTIEHRSAIPEAARPFLGSHVFGCDICQDVCPWNRRAPVAPEERFSVRNFAPPLKKLAALTEAEFQDIFRSTPVNRAKYSGFLRNVAVAMGNAARHEFREPLLRLSQSPDPLVAEHARWALGSSPTIDSLPFASYVENVNFPGSSGILLHPTSLPGRFGIGDFGPEAYAFADFLQDAGQSVWQMLPLGPTGYGDSPYQLFSAFAGNPLLVSPEQLVRTGSLTASDLASAPPFPETYVDFGQVIDWKTRLLARAHENFCSRASDIELNDYTNFCEANDRWLGPYALFMARKEDEGPEHSWTEWPDDPGAGGRLANRIDAIRYGQFEFFRQWKELKAYCNGRGIRVMGDVPIYVAHDSADVWSHRKIFQLDERGRSKAVSGVPPDYFSATGQLWGNPIYNWDELARTGFAWWVERLRASFATFDLIRLDHFRGFEAFWEVPAHEETAINGRWVKAPGTELFDAARKALGDLPIVAENLGVITPAVEAIRERFGFPGMAVLQFGFGTDPQAPDFRPHNYPRERFAYSGTHDNDTTLGWWQSAGAGASTRSAEDIERERNVALDYLNTDGSEMNWTFIRTLMASVAATVIFPLQDVLGLGTEARMNTPGVGAGNWRWRFEKGTLTPAHAERLAHLTRLYERLPAMRK